MSTTQQSLLRSKNQVEKLKSENSAMAELFRTNYEVWIGYHASLQENGRLDQKEVDNEILEKLLETDRMRVAQMQVRQAMRTADLMNQIMKAKSVAE